METWLGGQKMYEGFPLMLRRPANLDVDSLRHCFPDLAVVTHEFTKRLPNGLPDPDYNVGLADMDGELLSIFDVDRMGIAVLVETYGGQRNYYFYITADVDVEAVISPVARRYSTERLSWSVHKDPEWRFLASYASEHF